MKDKHDGVRSLPVSKTCFVCGEENAVGLRGRFYVEDDLVKIRMSADDRHCGYPGVVHGGVVAALLDECMGWAAARALRLMCVTAELTVRYMKSAPPDPSLVVEAWTTRAHRRMAHCEARLAGPDGEVYARAEGKFIPLDAARTLEVDDGMVYRGGEERVFAGLRGDEAGNG